MAQQVYTLLVQVGRNEGDGLPDGATGAGLLIYASGVDEAEAVRLFQAAARQRHTLACYNLGILYATGQGVARANLVGRPLTDPDVERLALPHHVGERLHGLFEGRFDVVAVRLVEVDVVGTEALERAVDRLHDVLARQAGVVGALGTDGPVDLGEDLQGLAAPTGQRAPQNLLGGRVGVGVGGVEGGDARVEGRADAGLCGVVFDLRPVGQPVAVGDCGNLQAAAALERNRFRGHRLSGEFVNVPIA